MTSPFDDPDGRFHVVVNDEEQYALWPEGLDIPAGWAPLASGDLAECTAYVDEHWVDMRPRSLKVAMAANATAQARITEDVSA